MRLLLGVVLFALGAGALLVGGWVFLTLWWPARHDPPGHVAIVAELIRLVAFALPSVGVVALALSWRLLRGGRRS